MNKKNYPKDDTSLIELFKNGDDYAFGLLYNKYRGKLTVNFSKICKTKDDLEDLLQETFLKAMIKIKEGKYQDGTFGGWLYVVGFNHWINEYRKKDRLPLVKIIPGEPYIHLKTFSPEEVFIKDESESNFNKLIDSLPVKERSVLRSWSEGYSYEEISEMQNIPMGTCRSRIHRAKKSFVKIR